MQDADMKINQKYHIGLVLTKYRGGMAVKCMQTHQFNKKLRFRVDCRLGYMVETHCEHLTN